MEIIVFDVGNAACAAVISPNGRIMMIDCGSNSSKPNPVDYLLNNYNYYGIKPFNNYWLTLLHITHPDKDHISNVDYLMKHFQPAAVHRRKEKDYKGSFDFDTDYKNQIDNVYIGNRIEIEWGDEFYTKPFMIPMEHLLNDENLRRKVSNNSSILRYIHCNDKKILFCGDMETEGFEWLIQNDNHFSLVMENGLDVLISPHHGHKSGFPKALFNLTGDIDIIIHSKGSEGNIDGTDVASQYSSYAKETMYYNYGDKRVYKGKVFTTRSNGIIRLDIGKINITTFTEKASPNHTLYI